MILTRDSLYLAPIVLIGGAAVGGLWGLLGATLSLALFALNIAAFEWLVPKALAGGDWIIWIGIAFSAKAIGVLLAFAGLAIGFGPYPVAIGIVGGLGGVCIRRLLSADDDDGSGYVGPPEGTGSDEAPG